MNVVIETMRGHNLGRCIYDGEAEPNTGIPGNVGGYTHERVINSPKAGVFTAKRHIGDEVQANEVIGYVDEEPVRAKITGTLRGILKTGLIVSDHLNWLMWMLVVRNRIVIVFLTNPSLLAAVS